MVVNLLQVEPSYSKSQSVHLHSITENESYATQDGPQEALHILQDALRRVANAATGLSTSVKEQVENMQCIQAEEVAQPSEETGLVANSREHFQSIDLTDIVELLVDAVRAMSGAIVSSAFTGNDPHVGKRRSSLVELDESSLRNSRRSSAQIIKPIHGRG